MPPSKKQKREVTASSHDDLACGESKYGANQLLLALNRGQLYAAKILKRRKVGPNWEYYIHYHGWKSRWDEWVKEEKLYPDNDESRKLQSELSSRLKESLAINNGKNAPAGEDFTHTIETSKPVITLIIPHTLQVHLMKEAEQVHSEKLVPLPRSPSVKEILVSFVETNNDSSTSVEAEMLKEMTDGLREYFDKALSMMLLYQQERMQYENIRKTKGKIPASEIYGGEHLLRLLVKLPSLLEKANVPEVTAKNLHPRLVEFLRFMEKNANYFLLPEYEDSAN
eukprot:768013-Hanusia_phi.AAC.10